MKKSAAILVLVLAALFGAPAMVAPLQAQGVQSAPIAAPVGATAESQALAPLPGTQAMTALRID